MIGDELPKRLYDPRNDTRSPKLQNDKKMHGKGSND